MSGLRRSAWIAGVAAAVGVAAGAVYAAFQPDVFRAETAIVVGRGRGPLSRAEANAQGVGQAVRDLVKSEIVAENVVQDLRLQTTPEELLDDVSVASPEPGVLRVSVDYGDAQGAVQIAQEVGLVFTRLLRARFPPLTATIWDPAHAKPGRVAPRPLLDALLGGAAGLGAGVLAAALVFATHRVRRPAPQLPLPLLAQANGREEELARREAMLTRREERLVRREAAVAARRDELELQAAEVESAAPEPEPEPEQEPESEAVPEPEPEPEPAPEPEPVPEPEPEPVVPPAPAPVAPGGAFSLVTIERRVEEHAAEYPDRVEEWRTYVLYLRDYAALDGVLPASFDALVWEVFGDLLDDRGRG